MEGIGDKMANRRKKKSSKSDTIELFENEFKELVMKGEYTVKEGSVRLFIEPDKILELLKEMVADLSEDEDSVDEDDIIS